VSSSEPSTNGSHHSADTLIPLVYSELRKLARAKLRDDRANQSLDATGLVHEAFLRLSADPECQWNNRGHFFAAAGEAMRRILIEKARSRQTLKRGAGLRPQELLDDEVGFDQPERLLELDEALQQLEAQDDRKANLVKLRFFVGLSNAEIARALEIHPATVARDWAYARAWLKRYMDAERER
jgi:RNA polymerase sigma factor (TIGR02999 family)